MAQRIPSQPVPVPEVVKNKMNLQTGDIVLLKDDSHHRNYWPMAGIAGIFADKHGDV